MTTLVDLTDVLMQISQPYFLYPLVFLSLAVVCVKIYLKFTPSTSRRTQSLLWLLPLFIPVFVLLCFPPQTLITALPFSPSNIQVPCPLNGSKILFWGSDAFSLTGTLCLIGIIAAVGYFGFLLAFGKKLAMRRFHVILMANNEYLTIQQKVKQAAKQLGITEPKAGLIENLMPNAFTLGYGRSSVVVFSLGLLEMLDNEEMTAVISHELSHLKAQDYLFKSLACTLNALSFFNPLSYFALSHAQKERELLADEKGTAMLGKPGLMVQVLKKVEAAVHEFPSPSLAERFSSSLFLVSPLAHRSGILAFHPQVSQRVRNIQATIGKPPVRRHKLAVTIFLVAILLSLALIASYSTIEAQKGISRTVNGPVSQYKVLMYNATAYEMYPKAIALLFPTYDNYLDYVNGLSNGWQVTAGGSIKFQDGSEMFYDSVNSTINYPNGTNIMLFNTR